MRWGVSLGVVLAAGTCARAEVIEFIDRDEWTAAAGEFTTVDFTGFPEGTSITDQYADLGVTFTGGLEHIALSENSFPNDGAGLQSSFADIQAEFATPQFWIAVDFPGILQFELFSGGQLIYTSSVFFDSLGPFAGLVSTEPFDRVKIFDPSPSSGLPAFSSAAGAIGCAQGSKR